MTTASTMINKFLSHIGVVEHPNGSERTIFGVSYGMNGVPWCDIALSVVGREASGSYSLIGGFSYTVNHANWFASRGKWGTTPKPGAVIFFDWGGSKHRGNIDHVGLVVTPLSNGLVRTVEGNSHTNAHPHDGVWVHDRHPSLIVGYGYPAYTTRTGSVPAVKFSNVPKFPGTTALGSTGAGVQQVQQRLKSKGYRLVIDGKFGSVTSGIVRQFQYSKGLVADGVVGPVTWNALWR